MCLQASDTTLRPQFAMLSLEFFPDVFSIMLSVSVTVHMLVSA